MKKKIIYILCAVVILGIAFGIYFKSIESRKNSDNKTINISIIADQEIVLNSSFQTNVSTLEELLIELQKEGKIFLSYENSQYGMYIKGLGKDELIEEEPLKSKYWTYFSDNNEDCIKNDFCPAASGLIISDGDEFVFELIKYE